MKIFIGIIIAFVLVAFVAQSYFLSQQKNTFNF
jgi:hypothetical protein